MSKVIFIFIVTNLFSQTNHSTTDAINIKSGDHITDFSSINVKEKMEILEFVKRKSNKVIIYFPQYRLEVQKIISFNSDSIEVELLDSWWWNKPKSKHSILTARMLPIESTSHQSNPSFKKILKVQDIIAIQILKDKNLLTITSLLPILIISMLIITIG